METPIKMDDLGGNPLFLETPLYVSNLNTSFGRGQGPCKFPTDSKGGLSIMLNLIVPLKPSHPIPSRTPITPPRAWEPTARAAPKKVPNKRNKPRKMEA